MVHSVRTSLRPRLRAAAAPGAVSHTTRTSSPWGRAAHSRSTPAVPSVDALSTSTTESGRSVCASTEASVRPTISARLCTGITMVMSARLSIFMHKVSSFYAKLAYMRKKITNFAKINFNHAPQCSS